MWGFRVIRDIWIVCGLKRIVLCVACVLGAYIAAAPSPKKEVANIRAEEPVRRSTRERPASFPHDKPTHRKVDCSKCHALSPSTRAVEKFPGHSSCVSCHNFAAQPGLCSICHEGRPVSKTQPSLFKFPRPGIATDFAIGFSHRGHLKPVDESIAAARQDIQYLRDPKCANCHKRIEPAPPRGKDMSMRTGHPACFECHGEKPVKPPSMNQCAECHEARGARSSGRMRLVAEFRHEDHEYDIRPKRKRDFQLARREDFLCSDCHRTVTVAENLGAIKAPAPNHCAECHNGKLGLPEPLPQNILESLRKR